MTYFALGYLPWQKKYLSPNTSAATTNTPEHKKLVLKCKEETSPEVLCGRLPKEFTEYMSYVRQLKLTDIRPDYDYLRGLFRKCGTRELHMKWKDVCDYIKFDWLSSNASVKLPVNKLGLAT